VITPKNPYLPPNNKISFKFRAARRVYFMCLGIILGIVSYSFLVLLFPIKSGGLGAGFIMTIAAIALFGTMSLAALFIAFASGSIQFSKSDFRILVGPWVTTNICWDSIKSISLGGNGLIMIVYCFENRDRRAGFGDNYSIPQNDCLALMRDHWRQATGDKFT